MDRLDALIGCAGDRVAIWRGSGPLYYFGLSAVRLVFPEEDHRNAPIRDVRGTEIG
jgi:hypothetical protein